MTSREHVWHYLILIAILLTGFLGFIRFEGEPTRRFLSIFGAILGYVLWGVWHHFIEKRLSSTVISEYLLLALVVLATAGLLIFPF